MKKLRKIGRKGEDSAGLGTLITIIILVGFLILMVFIFYGNGLIPKAFDKIRTAIRGVPEVDATQNQMDFHKNMDAQMSFFDGVSKAISTAAASKDQDFCFVELPAMDQSGFYDYNFNLYFDKSGSDMLIRLTESKSLDTQDMKTQGVDTPVSAVTITNAQPCVIMGASVVNSFYKQFNDRSSILPDPDIKSISPTPVPSILFSSSKKDSNEKQIGYMLENKYFWHTAFKNGDKTILYVMKISEPNGQAYMCFFPANNAGLTGITCNNPDSQANTYAGDDPKNNQYVDVDCFNRAGGARTLKSNFDNKLLDQKYICKGGQTTQANAQQCPCGGTSTGGGRCSFEAALTNCECLASVSNAKYKETSKTDFTSDQAVSKFTSGGKTYCSYTTESCNYYQKAKATNYAELSKNFKDCP